MSYENEVNETANQEENIAKNFKTTQTKFIFQTYKSDITAALNSNKKRQLNWTTPLIPAFFDRMIQR